MRATIWTGTGFEPVDDLDIRPPHDDEVTVQIEATGLCHSDLNPVHGLYPQDVPAVLGHEAAGRVVDAGADAGHLLGRRVVLTPLVACGRCRNCRRGSPTISSDPPRRTGTPFHRNGQPVHQFVRLGTFAERTVVLASQAIPVPDELPAAEAALLGCAVVTGAGAVERAGVRGGDRVLVTGAGGIGLNAVQAARLAGAEQILVCDRLPAKETIARRLGATDFAVTPDAAAIVAATRDLAPDGFDAAIECVGRPDVLEAAARTLAPGGRVVIVGLPGQRDPFTLPVRLLFQDKAILGCRMGSVDPHVAVPRLAALAVAGDLELAALITKQVPLADLEMLIDDLEPGRLDRGVMTIT